MAGTPFKMNGFTGFGNSPLKQEKKSYTKGTSDVHSKKERKQLSQEKFGLYKNRGYDRLDSADVTAAAATGIGIHGLMHYGVGGGVNLAGRAISSGSSAATGVLASGVVVAEGVRRMKEGKTGMTTSKATKFSGGKEWKRVPKKKYI